MSPPPGPDPSSPAPLKRKASRARRFVFWGALLAGALLWARPRLEEEALLQELEGSLSLEYANCAAADPTSARAEFCQRAWTETVNESELPKAAKARLNALAQARLSQALTLAALEACFDPALAPDQRAACSQRWARSVQTSRLSEPDKADLLSRFERRLLAASLEERLDQCHGLADPEARACAARWADALAQSPLTPAEGSAAARRAIERLGAEERELAVSESASAPRSAPAHRPSASPPPPSEEAERPPRPRASNALSI